VVSLGDNGKIEARKANSDEEGERYFEFEDRKVMESDYN
jgi:hypothetical protein